MLLGCESGRALTHAPAFAAALFGPAPRRPSRFQAAQRLLFAILWAISEHFLRISRIFSALSRGGIITTCVKRRFNTILANARRMRGLRSRRRVADAAGDLIPSLRCRGDFLLTLQPRGPILDLVTRLKLVSKSTMDVLCQSGRYGCGRSYARSQYMKIRQIAHIRFIPLLTATCRRPCND